MPRFSTLTAVDHVGFAFDIHPSFGTALIAERGGRRLLEVNRRVWREWPPEEWPYARRIRWIGESTIALWLVPSTNGRMGALAASETEGDFLDVGYASEIFSSRKHIFATYGETAVNAASPGDKEYSGICVFSNSGQFLFGLEDAFCSDPLEVPFEVSAACTAPEDVLLFTSNEASRIWRLEVERRSIAVIATTPIKEGAILALLYDKGLVYVLNRFGWELHLVSIDTSNGIAVELGTFSFRELFMSSSPESHVVFARAIDGQGFLISVAGQWGMLYLD